MGGRGPRPGVAGRAGGAAGPGGRGRPARPLRPPAGFGTAGLRGPLGAGPARVNLAVVRRTTAGLVSYLRDQGGQAGGNGVVVGHDARHRSAELAADAARVVAAGGLRAWHFRSALPTPVTAFAVRHLGAAAGVMVTASHNPAPDNGYKVYLSDGALVIPPHDAAIAAAASRAALPRRPGPRRALRRPPGRYRRSRAAGRLPPGGARRGRARPGRAGCAPSTRPCTGWAGPCCPSSWKRRASTGRRSSPPRPGPTRTSRPPLSPTRRSRASSTWPWPRPGASDADLVLANDPDADRLAVAVPTCPSRGAGPGRAGRVSGC